MQCPRRGVQSSAGARTDVVIYQKRQSESIAKSVNGARGSAASHVRDTVVWRSNLYEETDRGGLFRVLFDGGYPAARDRSVRSERTLTGGVKRLRRRRAEARGRGVESCVSAVAVEGWRKLRCGSEDQGCAEGVAGISRRTYRRALAQCRELGLRAFHVCQPGPGRTHEGTPENAPAYARCRGGRRMQAGLWRPVA